MYRKESGRDVVPNVTFWTELPGLVKVSTVLPAKSDSDAMFCLQSYQDLGSIDHMCINPIRRKGLIHM